MAKKIKDADGNTYVQKKPFYKKWWFILLVVIILIGAFSGSSEEDNTATSSEDTNEPASNEVAEDEVVAEETEEEKSFVVGDVVTVGDIDYTVNSVETKTSVGPSVYPTEAQDTFLVIDLTVKNNGNEAVMIDTSNFKLVDGEKSFDADASGSISANQDSEGNSVGFFLENLNPDVELQGKVVFDVTEAQANSESAQLGFTENMFSSDLTLVNLR